MNGDGNCGKAAGEQAATQRPTNPTSMKLQAAKEAPSVLERARRSIARRSIGCACAMAKYLNEQRFAAHLKIQLN